MMSPAERADEVKVRVSGDHTMTVTVVSSVGEFLAQLAGGVRHPRLGLEVPHPVIDGRQEPAIFHEVLFQNESDGHHAAIATVDEVTEDRHAIADTEHVVTDGAVTEVAHVTLRLIHPLV
jgi:hypothetical protein